MKPSNTPEAVALLTTKPELTLLQTAILHADPDKLGSLEDGIASRFYLQTEEPVPGLGSQTVEEQWRHNATFKVRPEDVKFVVSAAQGVLTTTRPTERIANKLTGRTTAAKAILAAFVDYK